MGFFEAEGITLHLNTAPPVYAPGGLVAFAAHLPDNITAVRLSEVETRAIQQSAVLMVVQSLVEEEAIQTLLLSHGYTFASSWYFGSLESKVVRTAPLRKESANLEIRTALASDVPTMLEIGERKREQYERFSPVFWKKAATPRQEFGPYVTGQVESPHNIALVAVADGVMRGYIIAQCRNLSEGYVDDYAVANPSTDWAVAGALLLAEARNRAHEKGVSTFAIVAGHADTPKRSTAESLGFTLKKNWLVKPLATHSMLESTP